MTSSNHTTKICSECAMEYPATTEYFHTDRRVKCGFKAACKKCSNARLANFRINHPKKIKEYTQNYIAPRRDELAKRTAEWVKNNPQKKAVQSKRYNDKYPDKGKAHSAVHYAIKTGLMTPATNYQCIHQGVRCKGQASEYHHYLGYAKDHYLDVIPVCSVCHKEIEKGGG